MCLNTNQQKKIILDKDIFVYKTCDINHDGQLCARYVDHHYSRIETAPIRVKKGKTNNTVKKISSGLHARINIGCLAMSYNTEWVIPKGSKVYYGNNYDIVSNKMIFNRLLNYDETNYELLISENDINWDKPSVIRFIKKWYRWFKNDY